MKRVIAAVGILAFVAALCAVTLYFQLRTIDHLELKMEEVQNAYDSGDIDNCMRLTNDLVEEYISNTKFFPYFMRHSDSSKIEESIVTLPVLLKSESTEHFEAELVKCRMMLEKLSELETPTMGNIL